MSGRIELPFERNFTSMHNYHFHDKSLSLKAIGLLSFMFSLPPDWDYSIRGLAACVKDGVDSIRATLIELEEAGYVIRKRMRDARGRLGGTDYIVYPMPQEMLDSKGVLPKRENPILDTDCGGSPILDFPILEKPTQEKPILEKPTQENPTQLNTNRINTNLINNESINQSTEMDGLMDEIRTRIGYEQLRDQFDVEELDAVVMILAETESSRRIYTRVGSRDVSTALVKSSFAKIGSPEVEYVLNSLHDYTTDHEVANPHALLMTFLYNAPSTISIHYGSQARYNVAHKQQ